MAGALDFTLRGPWPHMGPPSLLREGKVYATSTGWTIVGDNFYWAADDMNNSTSDRAVFAFSCDLRKNPLDPRSWRFSNSVRHPGVPQLIGRGEHNGGKWMEPNVVNSNGSLLVLVRVRVSSADTDGVVPGLGAVCDLLDENGSLHLSFSHYYPIPGAQNHFHIIRDDVSGLFWMTSNQVTGEATGCFRGWGKERRFLMLHYSRNALDWFGAGVLAMWARENQAFNYCTPLIDGDDLVFASRTAENAPNQHDNDSVTFHRLPTFRKTAVNLFPLISGSLPGNCEE